MEVGTLFNNSGSRTEFVKKWESSNISLFIKREDLLHPHVSGNKFRKLKYNLEQARLEGKNRLLTFGGAFSNHIAAVAAAGKAFNFETIGVIRGEELGENLEKTLAENPTLQFAYQQGMKFRFISREKYRHKAEAAVLSKLAQVYGDFYLIPEGGTNSLAVKGCREILDKGDDQFDFVCCPVGTGGTISGIINAAGRHQEILGFPALKGEFLSEEIKKYTAANNWRLVTNYHFGGYAKVTSALIEFINNFRLQYDLQLDPVYTGKMMYGIFDLVEKSAFPENSRILAIHTGGLQGIAGMNKFLEKKNLPIIQV